MSDSLDVLTEEIIKFNNEARELIKKNPSQGKVNPEISAEIEKEYLRVILPMNVDLVNKCGFGISSDGEIWSLMANLDVFDNLNHYEKKFVLAMVETKLICQYEFMNSFGQTYEMQFNQVKELREKYSL